MKKILIAVVAAAVLAGCAEAPAPAVKAVNDNVYGSVANVTGIKAQGCGDVEFEGGYKVCF